MTEHIHLWGPLERSRLAGTVHRKCQVAGCKFICAIDDEDDEDGVKVPPTKAEAKRMLPAARARSARAAKDFEADKITQEELFKILEAEEDLLVISIRGSLT